MSDVKVEGLAISANSESSLGLVAEVVKKRISVDHSDVVSA